MEYRDDNKDGEGNGDETRHNKNNNQPFCWQWTLVHNSTGDCAVDEESGSGSCIGQQQ